MRPVETLVNALRSFEEFGRLTDDVQKSLDDLLDVEANAVEDDDETDDTNGPTAHNPDTNDKSGETP
jgi:hypothetical protein